MAETDSAAQLKPIAGSFSALTSSLPITADLFASTHPIQEESLSPAMDVDIFSKTELLKLTREVQRSNQILQIENQLFDRNLGRLQQQRVMSASKKSNGDGEERGNDAAVSAVLQQPSSQQNTQPAASAANTATAATNSSTTGNANHRREKKKKGEKAKEVEKVSVLTLEQKADIAVKEQEEVRDEIDHVRKDWEKESDNLKAEMEEVELRESDIKKASYEFRRDIHQQAINPRTGKIIAEKVLRYFEEKIRSKEAIIEKTRLKNTSLKTQRSKLQIQLKQKEEMGEVLHAIDFDQLSIENAQYQAKIEEKNTELLKLKTTVANTVQTLNAFKQKLNQITDETNQLNSEIGQRKETLSKMCNERNYVAKEKDRVEAANDRIKKRKENYRVPEIMDYVMYKAKQQEFEVTVKSWERKVEIQEMAVRRLRRLHQKQTPQS